MEQQVWVRNWVGMHTGVALTVGKMIVGAEKLAWQGVLASYAEWGCYYSQHCCYYCQSASSAGACGFQRMTCAYVPS